MRSDLRPGLRIDCVISSLAPGGAEGVMARLAGGLAGRGHKVRLITIRSAGPGDLSLEPRVWRVALGLEGASTGPLSALSANLRRIRALRRAVLGQDMGPPQALLSFMPETNILALLALGGRLPVVAGERVHPAMHPLGRAWEVLRRLAYRRAAAIAVQTPDVAEFFPPGLRGRCVAIPNPVLARPGAELPLPEAPLAEALAAPGPVLLAMGRLEVQKGFDMLLPVFARLAPRFPDWRLVVVGEGPERARLAAQVESLGLSGRAFLPGATVLPGAAFARARAFVLPSRYEGFPNALAEAMAAGLPCVAFDCPSGPGALLRNGVDGLLVPPGDMPALEETLARLMGDAALASALAARAPEVTERFGLEKALDLWEALFLRLARGGKH